ncbi:alginate lyase family protein [Chitinophaga arvensicola]|uniref:Alginate lyase n=1 Tax=Chitinophaga arvensicola TaxID=29529 RepID=A0A1I0QVV7_9BACT|nr:alginate lyase family protein [Chitinophaga arvensicola]SEW31810.1 Alginate lyase [Chitinophaga arvensicola]
MKIFRTVFVVMTGLSFSAMAQQAPPTFLLDGATLAASKAAIAQHDPVKEQALKALLVAADRALTNGPYAVTFKSKLPPSGDKHDYMSVGPYWWPDSTKANGLPYIRRDGVVNPERYSIKDDAFYNSLCRDVQTLGLAWYFTGDKKYADKAAALLRTWFLDPATRMNPHLNYGQAIPGITEGRGIGLIDTHIITSLIDGIQLLKGSPALTADTYEGIQQWYRSFLSWMRTSPIGKDEADEKNNHGTWYDVQAVAIALFTQQPDLARQMLKEQTQERIRSQFAADGSQPLELARTLSWNYSYFNLEAFFELAMMAEKVQVDLWHYESTDKRSIRQAFAWMLPFATGSRTWEHQQIKPIHIGEYAALAIVAEKKYPELDLAPLWKLYPKTPGYACILTGWGE